MLVRIDKREFETEDGKIFTHLMQFSEIPSITEFQAIYSEFRLLNQPVHGIIQIYNECAVKDFIFIFKEKPCL